MNKNIETFIGCDNDYEESKIVIFGAPFDSTTSFRPGTRFASKAMRSESFGIETYSTYQDKDLEDIEVFDGGDLELRFGSPESALKDIEEFTRKILNDDKIPCMIGGEHLVTLGAFRAAAEKYPDVHVIHFDAHADLRDEYLGQKLSHASVMHRVWDIVGDNRIYQFGIRSGTKEEFDFSLKENHTYMEVGNINTFKDIVDKLEYKKIYITIDLDVFDPSIFPGTGTPEPGGVTYREFENIFSILKNSNVDIVGCDIVELSPDYDNTKVSTVLACKVLRELALVLGYNNEKNKNK